MHAMVLTAIGGASYVNLPTARLPALNFLTVYLIYTRKLYTNLKQARDARHGTRRHRWCFIRKLTYRAPSRPELFDRVPNIYT
jgi:hypothetical protein